MASCSYWPALADQRRGRRGDAVRDARSHWPKGPFGTKGGYEQALTNLAVARRRGLAGQTYSLDQLVGISVPTVCSKAIAPSPCSVCRRYHFASRRGSPATNWTHANAAHIVSLSIKNQLWHNEQFARSSHPHRGGQSATEWTTAS